MSSVVVRDENRPHVIAGLRVPGDRVLPVDLHLETVLERRLQEELKLVCVRLEKVTRTRAKAQQRKREAAKALRQREAAVAEEDREKAARYEEEANLVVEGGEAEDETTEDESDDSPRREKEGGPNTKEEREVDEQEARAAREDRLRLKRMKMERRKADAKRKQLVKPDRGKGLSFEAFSLLVAADDGLTEMEKAALILKSEKPDFQAKFHNISTMSRHDRDLLKENPQLSDMEAAMLLLRSDPDTQALLEGLSKKQLQKLRDSKDARFGTASDMERAFLLLKSEKKALLATEDHYSFSESSSGDSIMEMKRRGKKMDVRKQPREDSRTREVKDEAPSAVRQDEPLLQQASLAVAQLVKDTVDVAAEVVNDINDPTSLAGNVNADGDNRLQVERDQELSAEDEAPSETGDVDVEQNREEIGAGAVAPKADQVDEQFRKDKGASLQPRQKLQHVDSGGAGAASSSSSLLFEKRRRGPDRIAQGAEAVQAVLDSFGAMNQEAQDDIKLLRKFGTRTLKDLWSGRDVAEEIAEAAKNVRRASPPARPSGSRRRSSPGGSESPDRGRSKKSKKNKKMKKDEKKKKEASKNDEAEETPVEAREKEEVQTLHVESPGDVNIDGQEDDIKQ
ncbi:unnamed protein product [Amoebophrya sp. A25]|nr:unnamed protein product [Amoebophrya sp. A25]|eukprot:GSA25T00015809001.1